MKKISLLILVCLLTFSLKSQTTTQRLPLHEVFSSSTCGPCVAGNLNLKNVFAANQNKYTLIKYQMSWPGSGDPYYTAEGGTRRSFYNVNSVPSLFVDGNTFSPTSYNSANLNTNYNVPAGIEISATHSIIGQTVEITVNINPLQDYPVLYNRAYIGIVENKTTGNKTTNGETEFYNVMKKMLPNAVGKSLGALTANSPVTFTLSYTFPANNTVEEFYDLSCVVWVQNTSTKEVLQSAWSTQTAGLTDKNNSNNGIIGLFPNPATTKTYIKYQLESSKDVNISIFNIVGQEVISKNLGIVKNGIQTETIDCSELYNGLYILKLKIGDSIYTRKINIEK